MSSTYAGNPASYPATITRPSDGDLRDAASVIVGLDGLADRTAFLEARRYVADFVVATDLSATPNAVNHGAPAATATYLTATIATQVGDLVEIDFASMLIVTRGGAPALALVAEAEILANENGGGDVIINGSRQDTKVQATASLSTITPINLKGLLTIATAGTLVIKVRMQISNTSSGDAGSLGAGYAAALKIWRS